MIKKCAIVLLSVLYLTTITGFALNLHYCFNHIASVTVNAPAKGCSKFTGKWKCCKDSRIEVKVKDAHQSQAVSVIAKVSLYALPQLRYAFLFQSPLFLRAGLAETEVPDPPGQSAAIHLKNCILRV